MNFVIISIQDGDRTHQKFWSTSFDHICWISHIRIKFFIYFSSSLSHESADNGIIFAATLLQYFVQTNTFAQSSLNQHLHAFNTKGIFSEWALDVWSPFTQIILSYTPALGIARANLFLMYYSKKWLHLLSH